MAIDQYLRINKEVVAMLFSSMIFLWVFLPIVIIGNFILSIVKFKNKETGIKAKNIFLLISSLIFYAWGELNYLFIMLASILINYVGGRVIGVAEKYRKCKLTLIIILNLGILFVFKYFNMVVIIIESILSFEGNFIELLQNMLSMSGTGELGLPYIVLPIGISFFTFQAMSYVVDVYRKETDVQKNFFSFALYVSFFPQLVAGPIVKYSDIAEQLQKSGIEEQNIIKVSSEYVILNYILNQNKFSVPFERTSFYNSEKNSKVVFDLDGGLVLGGVETWSLQTAKMLENMGYKTYLSVNMSKPQSLKTDLEIIPIKNEKEIGYYVNQMIKIQPKYIIINFPCFNLLVACILKKLYQEKIKTICIIHNDKDIYYESYSVMQGYIDKCLVISKQMQEKLLCKGFPADKVVYLPWEIETSDFLYRSYASVNCPLHIGYAGRLQIEQKRIDLLLNVAKGLKEKNIPYLLEIAGNGCYDQELNDNVQYIGFLSHDKISAFWKKQDIMISCSDYEGHSITQCEAMAQGAVPIITDVSGAHDDITDRENGFIVSIGAVHQIIEKIYFLNENRYLLEIMGRTAYETIKQKNNKTQLMKLWNYLLNNDKF